METIEEAFYDRVDHAGLEDIKGFFFEYLLPLVVLDFSFRLGYELHILNMDLTCRSGKEAFDNGRAFTWHYFHYTVGDRPSRYGFVEGVSVFQAIEWQESAEDQLMLTKFFWVPVFVSFSVQGD